MPLSSSNVRITHPITVYAITLILSSGVRRPKATGILACARRRFESYKSILKGFLSSYTAKQEDPAHPKYRTALATRCRCRLALTAPSRPKRRLVVARDLHRD